MKVATKVPMKAAFMQALLSAIVSVTVIAGAAGAQVAPSSSVASIRVAAAPSVRIGATDEQSALLNAVAGATRLPNGQIVVGNRGGGYALLVFDAKGALVKKVARKGTGPGEIDYLLWLQHCGATLYTGDVEAQRVLAFTPTFSVARSFRFADQTYRLACNRDGRFVHMGWEPPSAMKPGVFRTTARFWLTGADSSAGVTLGNFPGSERFGMTNAEGRPVGSGPHLLGKETRVAIGSHAAYIATADSLTLLVFGLDGSRRPALRAPYTPVPATDADVDAEIERRVVALGDAQRRTVAAELRRMPRPKWLPATRDILVDAADLVWVQSYPSARQATVVWTIFAPGGGVATRVTLPAALEVFEIGRDYLLGQVLNADTGVPEIHLYAVTR